MSKKFKKKVFLNIFPPLFHLSFHQIMWKLTQYFRTIEPVVYEAQNERERKEIDDANAGREEHLQRIKESHQLSEALRNQLKRKRGRPKKISALSERQHIAMKGQQRVKNTEYPIISKYRKKGNDEKVEEESEREYQDEEADVYDGEKPYELSNNAPERKHVEEENKREERKESKYDTDEEEQYMD